MNSENILYASELISAEYQKVLGTNGLNEFSFVGQVSALLGAHDTLRAYKNDNLICIQ